MFLAPFLAPTCPGCGAEGAAPCDRCIASMERASLVPTMPGLIACDALLLYGGVARQVVAGIKYRNARAAVRWLGSAMAVLVQPEDIDLVTWAPTTPRRRRARGFDQAESLARSVAAELHRPVRATLVRQPGPPQTGRTLEERATGPAFVAVRPVTGARVLVVDDVVTTGATVAAAGRVLGLAGARSVRAIAAAHPR